MAEPKYKLNAIVKLTPEGIQMKVIQIDLPKTVTKRIKDPNIKQNHEISYFCQWHDIYGKLQGNYFSESALIPG